MKFLVVDDHAMVRAGVGAVLREASPNAQILQAADSGDALAIAAQHLDIDLIVLDLMMPGTSGMATLGDFGSRHPGIPVMVLSSSESPADVRRAIALGALGYVPKSASPETLRAALNMVLSGEVYVPTLVLGQRPNAIGSAETCITAVLTARQIDVLKLVGANVGNKEIAWRLDLSEKTVKAHLTAVFKALNVTNRGEAARVARDAGIA